MTRRFDIGPILVAAGALLLVVSLFLDWYGPLSAWNTFELTDVLLAGLGIAAAVTAAGVLEPQLEYIERRALPWIASAAFVLVAANLLDLPPAARGASLSTGAWIALAAVALIGAGTVLTFGRVSVAVDVEGRDRRRRVAAVDHQDPPTGSHTPVPRPSDSLLHPPETPES